MSKFASYRDLIAAFPTQEALAESVGVPAVNVRMWRSRNSIPSKCWSRVVGAAKALDVDGVTLDVLAQLAEPVRQQSEAA